MGPEFGQQSVYRARIRAYNILSSSLTSWVHWTSFMACWVWKLYGFSHRPGVGWWKFGQNFSSKRNAKTFHRVLAQVLKREKEFINWEFKKNNCLGEAGQMAQSTNTSNAISYVCRGDGFGIRTRADGRTTRPNGRILELMAERNNAGWWQNNAGWWQSETSADAWIQEHKHIVRSHDRRHEIAIKVHRKCANKCMMSRD